jgi:hypothetical protein
VPPADRDLLRRRRRPIRRRAYCMRVVYTCTYVLSEAHMHGMCTCV